MSEEPQDEHEDELTADEQAVVDAVLEDLANNPPFSCSFTFNWHGDQERAERATTVLRVQALMMRRRHPHLDFSRLKSIVFHHDYELALREVPLVGRALNQPKRRAASALA